jgi:hypothetical protein
MLIKSIFAAATLALALTAALPAGTAEAKSNVDINVGIGFGGGFYGPGYGHGYYEPAYEPSVSHVSCAKARKIVRWNGFHNVKSLDCSAPSYRFSGWRGGQKFSIKVNSWGEITRVSSH